ncbi:hypothetical protein [Pseudomonas sp. dw_358]|uniref:hypothetical protein n=1 Tax=Pseudomonas sp. dw_358 TaxID=2720083 RepID=UPI001BD5EDC7|nr:hypothetical protein [Pseudomonas sp. dw_358]
MPVDLDSVPAKLPMPGTPRVGLWGAIALPGSLLVSGLIVVFWPENIWRQSWWFWACVLVFPLVGALSLFAFGLQAYERRRDFVGSWNRQHDERMQVLLGQGQRTIAVLATAYVTSAGDERLARAILGATRQMKPAFLETDGSSTCMGLLKPPAADRDVDEYRRRLRTHFAHVLKKIEPAVARAATSGVVHVRLRHDGLLSDEAMLGQWQEASASLQIVSQAVIASAPHGLLWLDRWMDDAEEGPPVLSVEVNLLQQPVAGQGESVSAVLLSRSGWARQHQWTPCAWVHRPVMINDQAAGLAEALRWGRAQSGVLPRTWYSQVDKPFMRQLALITHASYQPLSLDTCHGLDDCIGAPGAAIGNLALVVSSEQASTEGRAQLLLLMDSFPQACVVRPA